MQVFRPVCKSSGHSASPPASLIVLRPVHQSSSQSASLPASRQVFRPVHQLARPPNTPPASPPVLWSVRQSSSQSALIFSISLESWNHLDQNPLIGKYWPSDRTLAGVRSSLAGRAPPCYAPCQLDGTWSNADRAMWQCIRAYYLVTAHSTKMWFISLTSISLFCFRDDWRISLI